MRENRLSGSEGGGRGQSRSPYPYPRRAARAHALFQQPASASIDTTRLQPGVLLYLRCVLNRSSP